MKRFCLLLILCMLLTACNSESASTETAQATTPTETVAATQSTNNGTCNDHVDEDNNYYCDICEKYILINIDFYTVNDLHGKIADDDANTHPGVDELSTFIKNARKSDINVILLSAGDMWQGTSESNLTHGLLATDWMNSMGFAAMTLGNHEFDWGEEPIEENFNLAQFPFLAINIYDRETNKQVSYCQNSHVVDLGTVQIGIIGAMGDCYSSISADKVEDVYFITGDELTKLVMEESEKLRSKGVDYIVYMIHDGYDQDKSGSTVTSITGSKIQSYYDTKLSDGYVDLVFEGHSHKGYVLKDEHGVHHLQGKGDNQAISHVEIVLNAATLESTVNVAELIPTGQYAKLDDHPIVEELLEKYKDQISKSDEVLGVTSKYRDSYAMREKTAELYYKTGKTLWGDQYDIVLGGGFMSARSPYDLQIGEVTYGMLYSIFPFDNNLVLCSIKGSDLQKRFLDNDDGRYFIYYDQDLRQNLDPNATYYIVTDTYSSLYGPNNLTEIERYDEPVYARDLLADYIRGGGYNN